MELSPLHILVSQTWDIKQQIKKLQDQETELLSLIKLVSNNQPFIEGPYVFKKEIRKGSIEYSKISLLEGVNLELYRKPDVIYWKLDKIGE